MASKKIHNFVKSKVSAHSNISIPFSKQRYKIDSQEEPLIFENLESDKEDSSIEESVSIVTNINNLNEIEEKEKSIDSDIKNNEDYEILEEEDDNDEDDGSISSNNATALRNRVGSLGKSMNSAFKDAHSAINAIMKESVRKKGIRKPSEFKNRPRFGNFGSKRKIAVSTVKIEEKNEKKEEKEEKSTSRDLEEGKEEEEFVECVINIEEQENNVNKVESKSICEDIVSEIIIKDFEMTIKSEKEISEIDSESVADVNINNVETIQPLNFTNLKILGAIGGFIMLFFLFSISKFILGILCGVVMSFGLFKIYESFFSSLMDIPVNNHKYPNLRDLMSPVIPHIEEIGLVDEYASAKASFSTWVNAVTSYHPSWYNIATTYSLHISLEGTKLRMRKPKGKVPSRSMWNDSKISGLTIVSERTVELLHAKVHLLPYGLVRRRMWSKKYPICITITNSADEKGVKPFISINKSSDPNSLEMKSNEENFFFFTRTCREKEEMFRRLMAASLGMPINLTISDIVDKYLSKEVFTKVAVPLAHVHDIKDGSKEDGSITKQRSSSKTSLNAKEPQIVSYVRYMAKFMPSDTLLLKAKSHQIDLNYISCESELLWLNALVGRVAWEVFRGGHWIKVIREKIQRKLKKLHLPYFVDQLEVIDIDLGSELPVIRKVSRPYLDYKGLWVEFEVVYAGGFSMGLETKINLMKLKNVASQQKSGNNRSQKSECSVKYNPESEYVHTENSETHGANIEAGNPDTSMESKMLMNMTTGGGAVPNDDEDKAEYSSDDSFVSSSDSELSGDKFDLDNGAKPKSLSHSSTNKSFLQWVDKIAKSSYFQKAADNKYVLRTMEYVSNTSLQLQVDAQYLSGTLVINIPPPPSDRLWWGFKKSPQLNIKARPKVGQKEIQMAKLVEFIEKKLIQEFHRAAVLPNMDDIPIPLLLNGNPEQYSQALL